MADSDDYPLRALARAAADGDEAAFERLFEQTAATVYGLARGLLASDGDAQDVVQETAIRAWQKLPALRDHGAVLGWMCRIARNACRDRIRSPTRRRQVVVDPQTIAALAAPSVGFSAPAARPDEIVDDRQTREQIHALIDELKPRTRAVFVMHIIHDMSVAEIAVALGRPIKTVESRLSRGRRELIRLVETRKLFEVNE